MTADTHHGYPPTILGNPSGPTDATGPVDPVNRDPPSLVRRTILVTGVSRCIGIGHAITCHAADYGANIVTHHYHPYDASQSWSADNIDAVTASIRAHLVGSARLIDIPADLAVTGEPVRTAEQAAVVAGHLGVLVRNQAMSGPDGSPNKMTKAVSDTHWTVDVRASILLAQAFAAQEGFVSPAPAGFVRHRGSIAFLTSDQDLDPLPGEITYVAAKTAIAGLTLTIFDELIDASIIVNTVNPGSVDTGYVTEEDREATTIMFPRGCWGEPDDTARLITWLLIDEARWTTRQVVNSEDGFARWCR